MWGVSGGVEEVKIDKLLILLAAPAGLEPAPDRCERYALAAYGLANVRSGSKGGPQHERYQSPLSSRQVTWRRSNGVRDQWMAESTDAQRGPSRVG
jgi:hypothetical protein